PPDTTTLRHRDGSAPPGPRPVRARTAEALVQIASWAGKDAFSRRGLEGREAVQWRRAWDRVRRHAPLLMWRGLLQRSTRRREAAPPHRRRAGRAPPALRERCAAPAGG